ncbi:Rv1733c family protein [Prauserella cavernicola]|uniref:Transmembrane protein n=1 Tax=Prauserella cavernicola TaxID=2800127 RepID=A0A934QMA1_9PSEU|nr:hypothetical protein [Prauserella cavernicola]MBK1782825.1 hypothetical protein [Prauserella cavernicola]
MASSGGRTARLWRRVHVGRNPLARRGDRLEARLLVTFLLVALFAIPVMASLGSETYAARLAVAEREAGAKHQAKAVLLADAPVSMTAGEMENVRVRASWRTPDGFDRVGEVATYRGSTRGTEIPVWLDERGDLTSPPVTKSGAATDAVSVAISAWLGVLALCALVFAAVRGLLSRLRAAQWAREWARVEREWSRR